MKISDLIIRLSEIHEEYGNINVQALGDVSQGHEPNNYQYAPLQRAVVDKGYEWRQVLAEGKNRQERQPVNIVKVYTR